jgi:hypothetical protein
MEKNADKNQCLSQNQALMGTSAQLGGIFIAILSFLMALYGSSSDILRSYESQLILFLVAFSAISFFTATTFYVRGTKPANECDMVNYLNDKGDVFFSLGLLWLLIVPVLLFHVLGLYLAMILCSVAIGIIWLHLFFDKDKVGIVALRLPLYGLRYLDCNKVHGKARDTKSKWNWVIITLFYIMLIAMILIGFYSWFLI